MTVELFFMISGMVFWLYIVYRLLNPFRCGCQHYWSWFPRPMFRHLQERHTYVEH